MEITVPFLKAPIGAGDVVKSATGAVGIKPCTPCEERRKRMNAGLKFTPRTSPWTVPPEVPEGWTREDTYEVPGRRLERFRHTDGKLIIWHVIDGRYQNSHTFCCGESMRQVAADKWEALCRSL